MRPAFLALACTLLVGTSITCAGQPAHAETQPPAAIARESEQPAPPTARADSKIHRILEVMGHSSTWGHPDLFGQFAGMRRLFEGDYKGAMHYFRIGARYADKLSQISIGMMYLNGQGVSRDPAVACAWITLAAERGYPSYVATRDRVCASLSPAQHDRAMAALDTLRPDYGDAVAKRRMKLELTSARRALTGSHLGYDGGVIALPPPGEPVDCNGYVLNLGGVEVPRRGCGRYDPAMWNPKKYFAARDAQWFGTVSIGELQQVNPSPAKAGKQPPDSQ